MITILSRNEIIWFFMAQFITKYGNIKEATRHYFYIHNKEFNVMKSNFY